MYLARDPITGAGFTLRELVKSREATLNDIDNIPSELEKACLIQTVQHILMPPRLHFGIPFSPSSGFRSPELEKHLYRKKMARMRAKFTVNAEDRIKDWLSKKQHPKGQAVDFEIPTISNLELAHWMKDNTDFDQLLLEFYIDGDPTSGWVHGSYNTAESNRHQVRTITKSGGSFGLPKLEGT